MITLIAGTQNIIAGIVSTSVHKKTLSGFGSKPQTGMDYALGSQSIWRAAIHGSTQTNLWIRRVRMLVYHTMAPILNMPIFIFRRMVILPLPIQLSLRNGGKNY